MADRKIVKARKCRVCEEWIHGTVNDLKNHAVWCERDHQLEPLETEK